MGGVLKAAQYIDFGDNPVKSVDKFYQFARGLSTVAVDKYAIGHRKMEEGGGRYTRMYGIKALFGVFIHISTVPTNTTNPTTLNYKERCVLFRTHKTLRGTQTSEWQWKMVKKTFFLFCTNLLQIAS